MRGSWLTRFNVVRMCLSSSTATPFGLAKEGLALPCDFDSKAFLTRFPRGAYSTARTVGQSSVFEWQTHVQRLADSVALMREEDATVACADDDVAALGERLATAASTAVRAFRGEGGRTEEFKLTWLVADADVYCHVGALPPLPSPPIAVEVRGEGRANALAKDSGWVTERAPLEALRQRAELADGRAINEIVLSREEDGALLEGSQTNFFAVIDNAVHTADEGILEGTVRRLLLEVCEREGIPVVRTPPTLASIDSWDGALISSTSRLALPVDELYTPPASEPSTQAALRRRFPSDGLAHRISRLVAAEVEAHSTQIIQE